MYDNQKMLSVALDYRNRIGNLENITDNNAKISQTKSLITSFDHQKLIFIKSYPKEISHLDSLINQPSKYIKSLF